MSISDAGYSRYFEEDKFLKEFKEIKKIRRQYVVELETPEGSHIIYYSIKETPEAYELNIKFNLELCDDANQYLAEGAYAGLLKFVIYGINNLEEDLQKLSTNILFNTRYNAYVENVNITFEGEDINRGIKKRLRDGILATLVIKYEISIYDLCQ